MSLNIKLMFFLNSHLTPKVEKRQRVVEPVGEQGQLLFKVLDTLLVGDLLLQFLRHVVGVQWEIFVFSKVHMLIDGYVDQLSQNILILSLKHNKRSNAGNGFIGQSPLTANHWS